MGFDFLLLAIDKSNFSIPLAAKCCFCGLLLENGLNLGRCVHNACWLCLVRVLIQQRPSSSAGDHCLCAHCPYDHQPVDLGHCVNLDRQVCLWLDSVEIKCRWFDGKNCTTSAMKLEAVRRHEQVCPMNPHNYSAIKYEQEQQAGQIRSYGEDDQSKRIKKSSSDNEEEKVKVSCSVPGIGDKKLFKEIKDFAKLVNIDAMFTNNELVTSEQPVASEKSQSASKVAIATSSSESFGHELTQSDELVWDSSDEAESSPADPLAVGAESVSQPKQIGLPSGNETIDLNETFISFRQMMMLGNEISDDDN